LATGIYSCFMDLRWTEKRLEASRAVAFEESLASQRIFLACVRLFLVCLLVSVALALWVLFPLSRVSLMVPVSIVLPGLFLLGRRHATRGFSTWNAAANLPALTPLPEGNVPTKLAKRHQPKPT